MQRILVIEDEADMRANLREILELERFDVREAGSGPEGIEIARSFHPELILCDVMMSGMDGFAVLKVLRQHTDTRGIPFIFLTGRTTRADLRQGMNLGADDYLTKPVTASELLAAIHARLKREQNRLDTERSRPFQPDFSSPEPLLALGLTQRESEVLLWVAQGKSNSEIGIILGMREATVKKHLEHIFSKLGVESRGAASIRALEKLPRSSGT